MVMLYEILSFASLAIWVGMALWCTPAMFRVGAGVARFNDPLRCMIALLVLNRLWFSARKYVFGSHIEVMSNAEVWWMIATSSFAVVCAITMVIVVRGYEKIR